jgi:hypothetical protein
LIIFLNKSLVAQVKLADYITTDILRDVRIQLTDKDLYLVSQIESFGSIERIFTTAYQLGLLNYAFRTNLLGQLEQHHAIEISHIRGKQGRGTFFEPKSILRENDEIPLYQNRSLDELIQSHETLIQKSSVYINEMKKIEERDFYHIKLSKKTLTWDALLYVTNDSNDSQRIMANSNLGKFDSNIQLILEELKESILETNPELNSGTKLPNFASQILTEGLYLLALLYQEPVSKE